MYIRAVLLLFVFAISLASCSAAPGGASSSESTSGDRGVSSAESCGLDQWRSQGRGLLVTFPDWCEGDARERALEWADARGIGFVTGFGNAITLETMREYERSGAESHARIERLDPRSLDELTCADVGRMLELGASCGVTERVMSAPTGCASGALTLDPDGVGATTTLGCAHLSREQCAAQPECGRYGACTPRRQGSGDDRCVVASDEDCGQIEVCRREGLECRFNEANGSCAIPGCFPGTPADARKESKARWEERAKVWAIDVDSNPDEAMSRRFSRLLAACDYELPEEDGEVYSAYNVHDTSDGFVGAFMPSRQRVMNEADIVRVRVESGRASIEHLASVDNVTFAGWDACVVDAERCFYDAASQTMMTGAPVCDEEQSLSACALWSARQEAWAHDLAREDLEEVLRGHLGLCDDESVFVHDLQSNASMMKLVYVKSEGRYDALLLAQRAGGVWSFDVLDESVHTEEGLQVSAHVRLVDDTLRHVFHPGPFESSFRYQVSVSATYGTFYEGEPACCEGAEMLTEVEVFLTSSRVGDEVRWHPELSIERRTEHVSQDMDELSSSTGTSTTIEPIDAKLWRLRTTDHMRKTRTRTVSVEPSKLKPLVGCQAP